MAKPIHLLCTVLLILLYGGAIRSFIPIVTHLGLYFDVMSGNGGVVSGGHGFLPGYLNAAHFFLRYLLVLTMLVLMAFMLRRNARARKARRIFVWVIALVGIMEIISYLNGWMSATGEFDHELWLAFLLSVGMIGVAAALIVGLYASGFMRRFFAEEAEDSGEYTGDRPNPFGSGE
jgi:hypothetical protein